MDQPTVIVVPDPISGKVSTCSTSSVHYLSHPLQYYKKHMLLEFGMRMECMNTGALISCAHLGTGIVFLGWFV